MFAIQKYITRLILLILSFSFLLNNLVYASVTEVKDGAYDFYFNDEEYIKLYNDTIKSIKTTASDLDLTEGELSAIKYYSKNPISYVPYSGTYVHTIDGKDYGIESLNIDIINKVLGTKIEMTKDPDVLNMSFQNTYNYVASNRDTLGGYLNYNSSSTVTNQRFELSDPYAILTLYVVSNEPLEAVTSSMLVGVSDNLYDNITSYEKYNTKHLLRIDPSKARSAIESKQVDYYLCSMEDLFAVTAESDLYYEPYNFDNKIFDYPVMQVVGANGRYSNLLSAINKIYDVEVLSALSAFNVERSYKYLHYVFLNSLTDEEANYIDTRGPLTVSLSNMYSLSDENDQGYTMDVLHLISKTSGLEFEYIEDDINKSFLEKISSDHVNIVPYFIQDYSEYIISELKDLDVPLAISEPYITRHFELLKRYDTEDIVDLTDLKYADVGTFKYAELSAHWFINRSIGSMSRELIVYDDIDTLMQALQSGEIKYAILTPGVAGYYDRKMETWVTIAYNSALMQSNDLFNWVMVLTDGEDTETLRNIINKSLVSINTSKISYSWFDYNIDLNNYATLQTKNQVLLYAISLVGAITVCILLFFIEKNRKSTRKLRALSRIDTLTGLGNKYALMQDFSKFDDYVCISLDINNFRKINEIYGYTIADEVLMSLGSSLSQLNIHYEYNAYRLGRDEFIVIVQKDGYIDQSELILKIFDQIVQPVHINELTITYTMRAGIVESSFTNGDFDRTMYYSKNMLLKFKSNTENKYMIFDEKENAEIEELIMLEKSLMEITEANIMPYYQPFIDFKTLKVTGCEVLARLCIDDVIYPAYKFIHIAENNGTVNLIDRMLFRNTIQLRQQLLADGSIDEDFYFSVNTSARFTKELSISYLSDIIEEFKLDNLNFLQIEILEEELTDSDTAQVLKVVTAMGMRSAVDDFSTGYSTLVRLTQYKFSVIKMDRSLLPIEFTEQNRQVYRTLVSILKNLDLKIIAEGIETKEHVDFLDTLQINGYQGYYFSRPLPLTEFMEYVKKQNGIIEIKEPPAMNILYDVVIEDLAVEAEPEDIEKAIDKIEENAHQEAMQAETEALLEDIENSIVIDVPYDVTDAKEFDEMFDEMFDDFIDEYIDKNKDKD